MNARFALAFFLLAILLVPACGQQTPLAPKSQTWAELRVVRRAASVSPPGEKTREPYPRERLVDGERVTVEPNGLAWLRRDAGATLLIRGPAELTLRKERIDLHRGRVFVDTPSAETAHIHTPQGPLHLAHVRASLDVDEKGVTEAYVLAGEVRTDGASRAIAGEKLRLDPAEKSTTTTPALVWDDWTGGLGTTDRSAEPAPYGIGTVGARKPGEQGKPRFPLAIQKLDVRVTIDREFALTEVDEVFFNPSSDTVEGIYRFRTPRGAILHRFGVDREGVVVWGRVKEKQAAAAQYQANVYEGSKEDPALLEWDAPGVYRARLYPIGPGQSRRVVVRYAEWLGRDGEKGERRLYVYPMAAEGAESTLPVIEELSVELDLSRAGAQEIRAGMAGTRVDTTVMVREHDVIPRADLALELFDAGAKGAVAYRAPHFVDPETLAPADRNEALQRSLSEPDYLLVNLRPTDIPSPQGGLDLGIVVDTSAATLPASLAVARAATAALLAHTGKDDRVAVWAGDTDLRPVLADRPGFLPVDDTARRRILAGLASIERGGATDLGAMLSQAAASLDPTRRGVIIYVGDGAPTVGESSLPDLRARLDKLPRPVRIYGLGVGDEANLVVLEGLARGAFAERISDAGAAARAALRILEHAERPALLGASIDLGAPVERIYPRDLGAIVAGESVIAVGRVVEGQRPSSVTVRAQGASPKPQTLRVETIRDSGDLSQRWAGGRLAQLLDEGAGRAAMVDLGVRHGIITPFTSLYVPTKNEMSADERAALERRKEAEREKARASFWSLSDKEKDSAAVDRGEGERSEGEVAEMRAALEDNRRKTEALSQALAVAKDEATRAQLQRSLESQQKLQNRLSAAGGAYKGKKTPSSKSACAPGDPLCSDYDGDGKADSWGRDDSLGAAHAAPTAVAAASAAPEADEPAAPEEAKPMASAATGEDTELSARGNMWGDQIGDSFGANGLGLSGIGEGGGGRSEGIGLGPIGSIGHGAGTGTGQGFGSGHGRLGGAHRSRPPQVRMGATSVNGRLPPEIIQRIVRQNFGRFRLCYDNGLRNNPNLQGRVAVRFVIDREGMPSNISNGGSDMPDASVVSCILQSFNSLSFPAPEGGIVTVVYPLQFSPGDGGPVANDDEQTKAQLAKSVPVNKPVERSSITVRIDDIPRVALRCSASAFLPFEDKVALWRERLTRVAHSAELVAVTYENAKRACELPTFRERARMISLMLDAIGIVRERVALWRRLFEDSSAADLIYRGLLARVRTPNERRELHAALGLATMDPKELDKLIKAAPRPVDRVRVLRKAAFEWPNDFQVGLRLAEALEDAGDVAGVRALARELRARPDADAAVRTSVGELYLRLAQKETSPEAKADAEREARRTFGEIVERAPDDPVARKRLGDLLRAHGWFADAARHYETLARLAPDDARVPLLLSAAAAGQGFLESAVKWTDKSGAAFAPEFEGGAWAVSRTMAATWLSWGLLEANTAGREAESKRIEARLERVLASARGASQKSARVVLSWAHPDLHPALWSNASGSLMPAPEGDATLGIAFVMMPERDDAMIELRLDPTEVEQASRLGAEAVVTVIFGDGRLKRLPLTFAASGPSKRRFAIRKGEIQEISG